MVEEYIWNKPTPYLVNGHITSATPSDCFTSPRPET